jgi:cyclopropane fatty-acyl-phospholipid synthase-like methyltransferase
MKSMKLYDQVERINNELLALGIDAESPLAVEDLTPFDQYHYHGTEAVDDAVMRLGIDASARVLEVGSGIGGPARHAAARTGCRITALELQPDLDQTARELTARCGLSEQVDHVCGDVLDGTMNGAGYDALMSYLVFLHIPDRPRLFDVCREALKPGGRIFIEDFTKLTEPSAAQWADLETKILCSYIPTLDEYVAHLEQAGFVDIDAHDMSGSWKAFTAERYQAFLERRPRNLEIHGADVTDGLEDFYKTASELYGLDVLGGIRLSARRP